MIIDNPVYKPADEPLHPAALEAYEFWVSTQVAALESRIQDLREGLQRERTLSDRRI